MPDSLDFARFQLDSVKAAAQIRIDYMKAVADFNKTMAAVAEKQVKVATDIEKLNQLRAARAEYKGALRDAKKMVRSVERQWKLIAKKVRSAARLEWGELIDPTLLTGAWAGFIFLVKQMPGESRREVMRTKINSEHRLGANFIKPRFPNVECDNAPGTIKTAISLFGWARRERCIPTSGSASQDKLFEIMDRLETAATALVAETTTELSNVRMQLLELRKMGWKAVKVIEFPPK